jgi:hypothetical protein
MRYAILMRNEEFGSGSGLVRVAVFVLLISGSCCRA